MTGGEIMQQIHAINTPRSAEQQIHCKADFHQKLTEKNSESYAALKRTYNMPQTSVY